MLPEKICLLPDPGCLVLTVSAKTDMSGDRHDTAADFFTQDVKFRVRCSFLEIYSERITDLLAAPPAETAAPTLKLGYDPQHGCFVKGLSSHEVQNGEHVSQITASLLQVKSNMLWP